MSSVTPAPSPPNPPYSVQTIQYCKKFGNSQLAVGSAYNSDGQDNDAYIVQITSDFNANSFFIPGSPSNGYENGFCIANRINGGYILGGNKTSSGTTGMYFMKLDESFNFDESAIPYDSNSSNTAKAIVNIAGGYVVVGKMLNPASNTIEGCFVRLNEDLEGVIQPRFFGGLDIKDLIMISDEEFFMIGIEDQTSYVYKLDASGENIWPAPQFFSSTDLQRGLITNDGYLAVVGFTGAGDTKSGKLITMDIINGTERPINKSYQDGTGSWRLYSLAQTQDNGFILGGSEDITNMLLIRTNRLGEN